MSIPEPFEMPKFACDDMLGKLARQLRTIGYFADYFRRIDDSELVRFAAENGRILLTRDTLILPRKNLGPHLFIESDHVEQQLEQVVNELRLRVDTERFFTICLICNTALVHIDRASVKDKVPPYVFQTQKTFSRCPSCEKIYWPATHKRNMEQRICAMVSCRERGATE